MQEKSIYIHIPFCRQRCPYCAFYSVAYDEPLTRAYADILIEQIRKIKGRVSTIYIGGGTPTVLGEELLKKLLHSLKRFTGDGIEFTVEANPESLSSDKLKLFLDGGVNRLSIGAQSFNDDKLRKLGRIHTAKEAIKAIDISQKIGFRNISIDLIFGVWGETAGEWKSELKTAVQFPVKHISCYSLTYEENTALFSERSKKKILPLDEEAVAEMYKYMLDYLPKQDFEHYEVSNFAKEGHHCRHNLNYWDNGPYIGLGASAVSYLDGVRRANVPDINEYIERVKAGKSPAASSERLSGIDSAKETAALKIRTKEGIGFGWFKEKTGFDFRGLEKDALPPLIEKGLIEYKKTKGRPSGIRLTEKGFLFCDTVSSALL